MDLQLRIHGTNYAEVVTGLIRESVPLLRDEDRLRLIHSSGALLHYCRRSSSSTT